MDKEFVKAIQANTAKIQQLIEILEERKLPASDWVDPDEAARIIGLKLTKSKTHRRRIRWLAEMGFLTRFRSGRPFMYWREELEEVSKRIADGEIVITGIV